MGKRKQSKPQHAGDEKRQQLQWNMYDNAAKHSSIPGSLSVISDNDPSLLEVEEVQTTSVVTDIASASPADGTRSSTYGSSSEKPMPTSSESESYSKPGTSKDFVTDTFREYFESSRLSDMFEDYLYQCVLCLTIHKEQSLQEKEWNFQMGKFHIKIQDHPGCPTQLMDLPSCQQCWLYIAKDNGRHMIYFEVDDKDSKITDLNLSTQKRKKHGGGKKPLRMFWNVMIGIPSPAEVFQGMSGRYFQFVLSEYNSGKKEQEIIIYGRESVLMELSHPSEAFRPKPVHQSVQKLMQHFHCLGPMYDLSRRKRIKRHDFHELYEAVMHLQRKRKIIVDVDVQHPSLKPQLRPYQRESVTWMLHQERFKSAIFSDETVSEPNCDLHPLYNEVSTSCGQTLYYNRHGGSLVKERPVKVTVPPGGILADEMGLGKTVEVLCCMLLHPRPSIALPPRLPTLMETQDESDDEQSYDNSISLSSRRNSTPTAGDSNQEENLNEEVNVKAEIENPADSADEASVGSTIAETVITPDHSYCHSGSDAEPSYAGAEGALTAVHKPDMNVDTPSFGADHAYTSTITNECSEGFESKNSSIHTYAKMPQATAETVETSELSKKLCRKTRSRKAVQKQGTRKKSASSTPKRSGRSGRQSSSQGDSRLPGVAVDESQVKEENTNVDTSEKNNVKSTENSGAENSEQNKKRRSSKFVELVPESEFKEADYFSTQSVSKKQFFECVCGREQDFFAGRRTRKSRTPYHVVECVDCNVSQHAECLNYDLNDPFRGDYKCPHCHVASQPVPSGATLIISPFQICHQWIEEIDRHVQEKCLSVFVYTGVNKQGFIQPRTLASQDIVVTTYETLRKELDYVDLPHTNSENGRRFRHPKRFMATPSPIIAVEWWRICLDEAQMVECVTTKTAEMALRLSAVNRWCVTGTPLMRSVEDIYGLLLFLGVDPFWVQQWWRLLLWEPFCHDIREPMHEGLAKVLWRTAKKDVVNQIDLPQQSEEIMWLTFSPVEDHFYRHLYHKCFTEAMRNFDGRTDQSTKLNTLDRKTVATLLRPLLNLRQACCHPQAVRGAFIPVQESMLTMEELLESLIKKARLECEEAHRLLVAALNGLAALQVIKHEPKEAVDLYREVLRSVEEHKGEMRTDDLQQLHAMYNLQEILATKPAGVDPTLRDDQLGKQCGELRERYMAKARGYTNTSREQLAPLQHTVTEMEKELDDGSDWWLEVLATASQRSLDNELVYKVREDLTENTRPELSSVIYKFRDLRGLQYVVQTQLTEMEAARRRLIADLKKLDRKGGLTQEVINKTVECCLRPAGAILKDCPFCKLHQLFMEYESKLFSFVDSGVDAGGEEEDRIYLVHNRRQGTWADSELEKALKSLLSFARSNRVRSDVLQYGSTHIKLLDGWKKEFKQLRVLWMALREEVSAVDELDMATMRLRIRLPDEPAPETPQPNVLEATELDAHRLKLMSDRTVNRGELKKKLGQLMYLKNLSKSQENMKEGKNPDPCPVCQKELGREWSVLQCGHCYCMDCIHILVSRYSFGFRSLSLKCPLCREVTHEAEISYVSTRQSEASDTSPSVKGSHSSKVAAITQCLLNIKQAEPHAKALVFSTWTDVLDVIGKALQENDITYTALHTAGKFQRNLTAFREKDEMQVLLLPFHSGANGLNLIEATHVLLVEPILNASQEAQAIGRVHRIGQTRPTKVHHFLVRRTIEERIHSLMESTLRPAAENTDTTASADDNAMTIGQLVSLFQDTVGGNRGEEGGEEEEEGGAEGEVVSGSRNGVSESGSHVLDNPIASTSAMSEMSAISGRSDFPGNSGSRQSSVASGSSTAVQNSSTSWENLAAAVNFAMAENAAINGNSNIVQNSLVDQNSSASCMVNSSIPGNFDISGHSDTTESSAVARNPSVCGNSLVDQNSATCDLNAVRNSNLNTENSS